MNVRVKPTDESPPHRAFTAEDVRRMIEAGILVEGENVELVDGELLQMAAKTFAHDRVKIALSALLIRALPVTFDVAVECTLRFSPSVLVEPDLVVFERKSIIVSQEGYLAVPGPELLLLVEVATSTLAYDRGRKAKIYARHGVPEYWVIDTNGRQTWIYREPTANGYGAEEKLTAEQELRPRAASLNHIAARLTDLG